MLLGKKRQRVGCVLSLSLSRLLRIERSSFFTSQASKQASKKETEYVLNFFLMIFSRLAPLERQGSREWASREGITVEKKKKRKRENSFDETGSRFLGS